MKQRAWRRDEDKTSECFQLNKYVLTYSFTYLSVSSTYAATALLKTFPAVRDSNLQPSSLPSPREQLAVRTTGSLQVRGREKVRSGRDRFSGSFRVFETFLTALDVPGRRRSTSSVYRDCDGRLQRHSPRLSKEIRVAVPRRVILSQDRSFSYEKFIFIELDVIGS